MKTRFNRREFSLGALAASTALARAGRPARAQAALVKIRVGWVVVPASLAPLILEKKDILKHFGQSYVAEATRFEGTPPVITALASGWMVTGFTTMPDSNFFTWRTCAACMSGSRLR